MQDNAVAVPAGHEHRGRKQDVTAASGVLGNASTESAQIQAKDGRRQIAAAQEGAKKQYQHTGTTAAVAASTLRRADGALMVRRPSALALDPALEEAFLAMRPSSLSSVRLSDAPSARQSARAFVANHEARLYRSMLNLPTRGAGSVDLGLHLPDASADTVVPTARFGVRNVQDVGLDLRVPQVSPLAAVAPAPRATSIANPPADNVNAALAHQIPGPVDSQAQLWTFSPKADVKPFVPAASSTTPQSTAPPLSATTRTSPASIVSNGPVAVRQPSFFAEMDSRARDTREAPQSARSHMLGYTPQATRFLEWAEAQVSHSPELLKAREDVARMHSTTATHSDVLGSEVLRQLRNDLRRGSNLETRCLEGERARDEEQQLGRRLRVHVLARRQLEAVVDAFQKSRAVENLMRSYNQERKLADQALRAKGLLDRARFDAEVENRAKTSATMWQLADKPSMAILWAGDQPFFVDWSAYIAMYRYGPSRALKELEAFLRREKRKMTGVLSELQMLALSG